MITTTHFSLLQEIKIEAYDYELPPQKIAWYPVNQRDASKLLISTPQGITEATFSQITDFLPSESLLIFNETKVVQARLQFYKASGARIEIFCLEPLAPFTEIQTAFIQPSPVTWKCLVGNSRRWKEEELKMELSIYGEETMLRVRRQRKHDGYSEVEFWWDKKELSFSEILEAAGEIPLPPYIRREAEEDDKTRYQTVYARHNGSVAAPTAGLHFTKSVLQQLEKAGIQQHHVTLHVGAGTFKPVSSEKIKEHTMHTEQIMVQKATIEALLHRGNKKIIPVGTTTARTLESIYWFGAKLCTGTKVYTQLQVNQWDPYTLQLQEVDNEQSLNAILQFMANKGLETLQGETSLLIGPGYHWHFADALITNFHQPRSTLLLLVSAFIGNRWRTVYDYALANDFRFLSFGDSCLFFP